MPNVDGLSDGTLKIIITVRDEAGGGRGLGGEGRRREGEICVFI